MCNGMASYGMLIPFGATFLNFIRQVSLFLLLVDSLKTMAIEKKLIFYSSLNDQLRTWSCSS
jgi:hypothetical protein